MASCLPQDPHGPPLTATRPPHCPPGPTSPPHPAHPRPAHRHNTPNFSRATTPAQLHFPPHPSAHQAVTGPGRSTGPRPSRGGGGGRGGGMVGPRAGGGVGCRRGEGNYTGDQDWGAGGRGRCRGERGGVGAGEGGLAGGGGWREEAWGGWDGGSGVRALCTTLKTDLRYSTRNSSLVTQAGRPPLHHPKCASHEYGAAGSSAHLP